MLREIASSHLWQKRDTALLRGFFFWKDPPRDGTHQAGTRAMTFPKCVGVLMPGPAWESLGKGPGPPGFVARGRKPRALWAIADSASAALCLRRGCTRRHALLVSTRSYGRYGTSRRSLTFKVAAEIDQFLVATAPLNVHA